MRRKQTVMIFDEKSEPLALSRIRRKPGSVFVIVPSEYLGGADKWFDLVAENMVKDVSARRQLPKSGRHVA